MATCSSCGAENPAGAKFCTGCGASLQRVCPACGTENGAGARFCSECGGPLAAAPAGPPSAVEPAAERRLVSVLFADLVGFTTLSESRDAAAPWLERTRAAAAGRGRDAVASGS